MKTKSQFAALFLTALFCLTPCLFSQENKPSASSGMPPMGPPEEMKQAAFLVGTWDFTMQLRVNPADTFWMTTSGSATCELVFGGAAVMSTISEPPFMGMTFAAGSLMSYDRELKHWQLAYIDNMSARINLYPGTRTADGWVFQGESMMMGRSLMFRSTMSKVTDTSYDWQSEMSSDSGKTWAVRAKATYTKRK